MKYQVIIAEETPLFRQGLMGVLSKTTNFDVTGESAHLEDLMALCQKHHSAICLVDPDLPGLKSYAGLTTLTSSFKNLKVISWSRSNTHLSVAHSLKAGAVGCISKSAEPAQVLTALNEVASRGYYFPENSFKTIVLSALQEKVASKGKTKTRPMVFSEREVKVLEYLSRELTNAEIGHKMKLSPRTVEGIRQNMCDRVKVKGAVGLVMHAAKLGLISI